MNTSDAASFASLLQRTGLKARGVQANAVEDAAASTAKFAVFKDREVLQLHARNSDRTYDFSVTYQIGKPGYLESEAHDHLRGHFPDDAALLTHLKRLLAADFSNLGRGVTYSASYLEAHDKAFLSMGKLDPRRRALENWTSTDNEYTFLLNSSLLDYASSGEVERFENEDPLRQEEEIDPIQEEVNLTRGVLALPPLDQVISTLRVATANAEHYSKTTDGGRFAIAGKIEPGDYVSNYPIPMSTTSGTNLEQFSTLDANEKEIRIYQVFGKTGRPLLKINPVDDEEKEVLYHSRSTFQLLAAAHAVPSDHRVCPRVVALCYAVEGKDPKAVKNIHTGLSPKHFLDEL